MEVVGPAGDVVDAAAGASEERTGREASKKKLTKQERKVLYGKELREPLATWRRILKDIWLGPESKEVKTELCETILNEIFDTSENAFEAALSLHEACPDYSVQKTSTIAGFVVLHFDAWLRKNEDSELLYSACIDEQLQVRAFAVATFGHTTFLELLSKIYGLGEPEMETHVLNAVKKAVEQRNYAVAIACATHFKLQSHFKLEELVVPCLLQDLLPAVEKYILHCEKLQVELISYLDGLVLTSAAEKLRPYISERIMTVPLAKFEGKALKKQILRLRSTFGLPEKASPDLLRIRQEGALKYIAMRRFQSNDITEEAYEDFVSGAIDGDYRLQFFFIYFLLSIGEGVDAVRWAVKYGLEDRERVRPFLSSATRRAARLKIDQEAERRSRMPEQVMLLTGHPIVLVDTPAMLENLDAELRRASIIGIDCEFKPQFMTTREEVALLQISVEARSYLVDVLALQNVVSGDRWTEFFRTLFCTEDTIKLGFDLGGDIHVLTTTFPFLASLWPSAQNTYCLLKLVRSLGSANDELAFHLFGGKGSGNGEQKCRLMDIAGRLLDITMDKREQVSNWAARPLRAEQQRYAAMDAYCLLGIFQVLSQKARECEVDWEGHLAISNVMDGMKPKEEKKPKKKISKIKFEDLSALIERTSSSMLVFDRVKPADIKLIVDSMLFGLGKHLRCFGIDTLLAETRVMLVGWAKSDRRRIILTTGKAHKELSMVSFLSATERLIGIQGVHTLNGLELLELVIKRLNIYIEKEDLFTRCMVCNSNAMVLAPSPVLEAMFQYCVVDLNPFSDDCCDFQSFVDKIRRADPGRYLGIECEVNSNADLSWVTVHSCGGTFDITHGLVFAKRCDMPTIVQVAKVPQDVLSEEGRVFYVCGSCGKVYFEGSEIVSHSLYKAASESVSEESIDCF